MEQRLAWLAAWARRIDGAVARASGPGSAFDRRAGALERTRAQSVRRAGAWLATRLPESAAGASAQTQATAGRMMEFVRTEPTGIAGGAFVFVVALVLVRLLWTPLSWPASTLNVVIATVTPTSCRLFGPENVLSDTVCGTALAVLTVAGALGAMAALVLLRQPLRKLAAAVLGTGARAGGVLTTPVSAGLLFTVGWAGVQYHFPERPGFVRDGDFPAVVALLAYVLARYGAVARTHAGPLFEWGAALTLPGRFGVTLLVPFAVSVVTIPVWNTPLRDQAAVMASMLVAYVMFAPRPAGAGEEAGP